MRWHIIEGEAGCAYAVSRGCVAIVVDALRASATAAMLCDAGATEILAVREVAEAHAAKTRYPDALLFGERGGLPPEGFDYGNSPRQVSAGAGRMAIFTTTTGAGRLVSCWGAKALYMGTTVNASAVARAAAAHETDVVLIPAGLTDDPAFDAQEDRVAAVAIALAAGKMLENSGESLPLGEGKDVFEYWRDRIAREGVEVLFATAPHAEKLRRAGLAEDIAFCAQTDATDAVPMAVDRNEFGIMMRNNQGTGRS